MENSQTLHGTGAAENLSAASPRPDERISQSAKAMAREVGDAVEGASSAAAAKAKELVQQQLAAGGDIVAQIAQSTRVAGDHLDREVPQLATLVKRAADSIDDIAHSMRDRSVNEIVQAASDLGRRQPAILFGITAVLGFLAYRLVNEGIDSAS
jgi:ElaB/YqjD/DUF883 family membrane-anchored ribosome-binding protein